MLTPLGSEEGLLHYTGIAVISGDAGFQMPVWAAPSETAASAGALIPGGYVPFFRATDDHRWLEITMHNGTTAWLQNDPAHVEVVLPDPGRVRVVIDPGHGGTDNGATANGLVEKDIAFDIAYWGLYPRLQADNRIDRVWLTRNGDYFVTLRYRWDLANAAFPGLLLSVHLNASTSPETRGTETYFKCGTEATPGLAADSRRAACLIHLRLQEQIAPACGWNDRGAICRRVSPTDSRSYYYILQNSNLPAVLSESLYLTNPADAACLSDPNFRDQVAQGLYNGITDFLFTTAPGTACSFVDLVGH